MSTVTTVNLTLYIISFTVLCALIYSAMRLSSNTAILKRFLLICTVFAAGNLCCIGSAFLLAHMPYLPGILIIPLISASYLLIAYGMALYTGYLYQVRRNDFKNTTITSYMLKAVWILSLIQMIHTGVNLFAKDMFLLSADHQFVYGDFFGFNEFLIFVQIFLMIILTGMHKGIRMDRNSLFMILLLPASALIIMVFDPKIASLYPSFTLSLLAVYVNVHLQDEHTIRASEIELQENRLSLLIGQIQPHFVFNVLNTVYYLCDTDAETAAKATHDFRMFLQNATDKRYYDRTIPFEQELENVMYYTNLEILRFDQIGIVYDIETKDFPIPPLTVQPLVENAIRHGCREMDGGRIVIRAREKENGYSVEIIDNGEGYQPEKINDGRVHVGIENVRNRLSIISGASLSIHALEEGGTCAEIFIPKK